MSLLMQSAQVGQLIIERITEERFMQAQVLRRRYHDKPDISFTDLTSMVVMNELGISRILSGDAHFTHVGLGFQLVP